MAPTIGSTPSIAFNPNPAPATFPILNAKPPITIIIARSTPNPGNTLLAISCPRKPETAMIRQTFTCATMSKINEIKMTNPKLAANCCVNTVVCVKNLVR